MTPMEKYQDMYRKSWLKQMILDRKNPLVKGPSQRFKEETLERVSGPAPKPVVTIPPMTLKAKVINRMMKRGLHAGEIAEILGVTRQNVASFGTRFQLPRPE